MSTISYEPYPGRETRDKQGNILVLPRELVDAQEMAEITEAQKRMRNSRIRLGLTIGAITLAGMGNGLQNNIMHGKEALKGSEPSVEMVYSNQNLEHQDTMTVVMTGLGTRNADKVAAVLTAHRDMGSVAALEYSNNDIDIPEIAKRVVELADKSGHTKLFFDGYSAGGPIALAVAAYIHNNYPNITIVGVSMGSSPIGEDGISPKSQESARKLSTFVKIDPDLLYSSYLRYGVEMYSRRDQFFNSSTMQLNLRKLIDTSSYVYRSKIADKDAASGELIAAQYYFLEDDGASRNLKILARPNTIDAAYTPPEIFYTRADDPSRDTTVNDMQSQYSLKVMTDAAGLHLTVVPIKNAEHADPRDHPNEYNQAMKNIIQPIILRSMLAKNGPVQALPPAAQSTQK